MAPFTRQQEAVAKEVAAVARALKRQRASKRKKTEFTYASYKRMYQENVQMDGTAFLKATQAQKDKDERKLHRLHFTRNECPTLLRLNVDYDGFPYAGARFVAGSHVQWSPASGDSGPEAGRCFVAIQFQRYIVAMENLPEATLRAWGYAYLPNGDLDVKRNRHNAKMEPHYIGKPIIMTKRDKECEADIKKYAIAMEKDRKRMVVAGNGGSENGIDDDDEDDTEEEEEEEEEEGEMNEEEQKERAKYVLEHKQSECGYDVTCLHTPYFYQGQWYIDVEWAWVWYPVPFLLKRKLYLEQLSWFILKNKSWCLQYEQMKVANEMLRDQGVQPVRKQKYEKNGCHNFFQRNNKMDPPVSVVELPDVHPGNEVNETFGKVLTRKYSKSTLM